MAIFIATEATLFGALIASFVYLRFRTPHWPPDGIPKPELLAPLALTGMLVLTSVPMQLAFTHARRGLLRTARLALGCALIVQATYVGVQLHFYLKDLHTVKPREAAYGSVYSVLLGAHLLHVLFGVLLTTWILFRLLTGLTRYRLTGLHATTLYWHFVNVLALVVTATQLSSRW
jgi:heme/copper-type cytochrome/quinol oxidase subunit 3